ncbi:hypothetical protein C8035_v007877 [Colletotrichum spinosum]|uniref:Uncharacterized protein n=1 Tax=Colletotrichum spinosum TaxID=1347390 RepID=A0A4R8QM72_9PEZI|nr:hypothetical protein C8035_v007877 [Colletotrichum spinosum]
MTSALIIGPGASEAKTLATVRRGRGIDMTDAREAPYTREEEAKGHGKDRALRFRAWCEKGFVVSSPVAWSFIGCGPGGRRSKEANETRCRLLRVCLGSLAALSTVACALSFSLSLALSRSLSLSLSSFSLLQ